MTDKPEWLIDDCSVLCYLRNCPEDRPIIHWVCGIDEEGRFVDEGMYRWSEAWPVSSLIKRR